MRGGLVILVLVTAVATAGCSSDAAVPEAEAEAEAADAPATTAPTTTEAASGPQKTVEEEPPSRAEIAWVGRLVTWAQSMSGPVEAAIPALDAKQRLSAAERRAIARALTQVQRCPTTYARIAGEPPSERLQEASLTMRDACRAYVDGASYGRRLLRDRSDTAARADWVSAWDKADRLLKSTTDVFIDYQPSNRKELPTRRGRTNVSRVEPVFGLVAVAASPKGALERRPEVRCWSKRDWRPLMRAMHRWTNGRLSRNVAGFAGYADHRVNLAPEVCQHLVALRYRNERPPALTEDHALIASSVSVLVHEAEHARGVYNEAAAECYAMQRIRKAARLLGADAAYADSLADVYWEYLYEHNPPAYRSAECRDGGGLDAFPRSARWP